MPIAEPGPGPQPRPSGMQTPFGRLPSPEVEVKVVKEVKGDEPVS